ncbi:MAG: hypothetical protein ACRESS_08270 [Stenotrophobium sp.]
MREQHRDKSHGTDPVQLENLFSTAGHRSTPPGKARPKPAAVLFLTFNRPDLFRKVLHAASRAGPRAVYVSIDGPRATHVNDGILCNEVRKTAEEITWATEVHLKAEQKNLGCGPAVAAAISWALEQAGEVIILEDDCLPDPSFLLLCDELLERYRDDARVMQISGTNWGASAERYDGCSYAFNSFAPIWGWATWQRAWRLYEYDLASWPRIKSNGLAEGMALSTRFRRLLARDWDLVRIGKGTWDHQWQYSVLRHHGLSISPARNLVVNLGFRADGTQLKGTDHVFSNLPLEQMPFPLQHPAEVARSASVESVFERIYWQKLGGTAQLYRQLVRNDKLRKVLSSLIRTFMPRPT